MENLERISCVTLLTQKKTYQIDGLLYRYLYSEGRTGHTQYLFRPLPAQRKKADLKLNRDKVLRNVYEAPSLYDQHHATQTDVAIQQSLF